jgi:hypothetical protein
MEYKVNLSSNHLILNIQAYITLQVSINIQKLAKVPTLIKPIIEYLYLHIYCSPTSGTLCHLGSLLVSRKAAVPAFLSLTLGMIQF